MSARERIAAAVEYVRSGQGNYEQCSRHFGMTLDVVKKACAAAGVAPVQVVRIPERPVRHSKFRQFSTRSAPLDDVREAEFQARRRDAREAKFVTRAMETRAMKP